jgi:hypothetical protein
MSPKQVFPHLPPELDRRIREAAINPDDVRSVTLNPDGSLTLEVYDAIDAQAILEGRYVPGAPPKIVEVPA